MSADHSPGAESAGDGVAAVDGPGGGGKLTHLDADGNARMIDVGAKPVSRRVAIARARVRMSPGTAERVAAGRTPKAEALSVSRIAGIQAAKRTGELIPLCHPLPLSYIDVGVEVDVDAGLVTFTAEARISAQTGIEMEAMTAASVAALTLYDMVKGLERGVTVEEVALVEKRGGASGTWRRTETSGSDTPTGAEPAS